jgi:4-phytase/acid phosphatase
VRAPSASPDTLASYSSHPWPSWPVEQGELTQHGRDLATLMGTWYRASYAARGLLASTGCPSTGDVHAIADVEERTIDTAESLLEGLFPGCGIHADHLADTKVDPLFHPVAAGLCAVDADLARKSVLGRIGGDFSAILAANEYPIANMQAVLGCCAPKLCEDGSGACTLADVSSSIDSGKKGAAVKGPIGIASTAGETFLMEYAEGLPAEDVAWGNAATSTALNRLLPLHLLDLDLTQRTPYLAARQGSNLAATILGALGAGLDKAGTGPVGDDRFVLLVGHDTNIAAIAGLLHLDWALPSYLANETPPGGAIAFELMRDDATGERFVQVDYYSQTLDQLRNGTPLDLANPPGKAEIAVPGCIAAGYPGAACPWADFARIVGAALDPQCVSTGR